MARFPGRLAAKGHSHRFKGESLVIAAGVYGEEPALPATMPAGNAPPYQQPPPHPRRRNSQPPPGLPYKAFRRPNLIAFQPPLKGTHYISTQETLSLRGLIAQNWRTVVGRDSRDGELTIGPAA